MFYMLSTECKTIKLWMNVHCFIGRYYGFAIQNKRNIWTYYIFAGECYQLKYFFGRFNRSDVTILFDILLYGFVGDFPLANSRYT